MCKTSRKSVIVSARPALGAQPYVGRITYAKARNRRGRRRRPGRWDHRGAGRQQLPWPAVTVKPSVTPNKAGTPSHPQGVKLKATINWAALGSANQPIVTKFLLLFPKGARYNGGHTKTCPLKPLRNLGPSVCPKASIMGTGSGTAYADTTKTHPKITVVNGGQNTIYFYTVLNNPARVQEPVIGHVKKMSRQVVLFAQRQGPGQPAGCRRRADRAHQSQRDRWEGQLARDDRLLGRQVAVPDHDQLPQQQQQSDRLGDGRVVASLPQVALAGAIRGAATGCRPTAPSAPGAGGPSGARGPRPGRV